MSTSPQRALLRRRREPDVAQNVSTRTADSGPSALLPIGGHDPASFGILPTTRERLLAQRGSGEPLQASTRAHLERGLGHSLSSMRIHADAAADALARDLDAVAFTSGQDVFFRAGRYDPASPRGVEVIAHEAVHVAQGSSDLGSEPARLSDPAGPAERGAHDAAHALAVGGEARVPPGGLDTSAIHRWPWDDDSSSSGSGGNGGSLLDSVTSGLSTAASWVGGAAATVYDDYEKSTDYRGAMNTADKGIDWLEAQNQAGNDKMVKQAEGIPVIEQLAKASAFLSTETTDLAGGVLKGVGDVGVGVGNLISHPIDTAVGMEGMLEHLPTIPGLSSTLKGAHGLYDLAVNGGGQYGNSLGDLADRVFNPLTQEKDDGKYDSDLALGILTPGAKNWDEAWQRVKDNPADTLGRAATNVLPMAMGVYEAGTADAGEAANAARAAAPKVGLPETPSAIPETPSVPEAPPSSEPPTIPDRPVAVEPPPSGLSPEAQTVYKSAVEGGMPPAEAEALAREVDVKAAEVPDAERGPGPNASGNVGYRRGYGRSLAGDPIFDPDSLWNRKRRWR
jgi:hypothetical protein